MERRYLYRLLILSICLLCLGSARAFPARNAASTHQTTNLLKIDASMPVPEPQPVAAALGSDRSPSGVVLTANSQYLTLGGQPWLPVMG